MLLEVEFILQANFPVGNVQDEVKSLGQKMIQGQAVDAIFIRFHLLSSELSSEERRPAVRMFP